MCDCGRPKFECRNEANRGLYVAADVTCYAQAAVEEHTGQEKFKPDPGQRFYATEIDDELITRRAFDCGEDPGAITEGHDGEPKDQHDTTDQQPEPYGERHNG